ncbi:MAG TPA: hypothetical protein VLK78_00825 [Candidatus Angelobacter sp.]|nr:hypothetical protein [Candidatus Angelobacter sp.]
MREGNKALHVKIANFYRLLETLPDQASSAMEFTSFLRAFLRIHAESTLPTIEIMTVLKKSKPIVFSTLRKAANNYDMLQFLVELSMDENEAEENLELFLNKSV